MHYDDARDVRFITARCRQNLKNAAFHNFWLIIFISALFLYYFIFQNMTLFNKQKSIRNFNIITFSLSMYSSEMSWRNAIVDSLDRLLFSNSSLKIFVKVLVSIQYFGFCKVTSRNFYSILDGRLSCTLLSF